MTAKKNNTPAQAPAPAPAEPAAPTHHEAPASWNCRYIFHGFDCQLTLRGETGSEVLAKSSAAIKHLIDSGAEPTRLPSLNHNSPAAAKPNGAPVPDDPAWCPIHQVSMPRRERNGEVWYSHKVADGLYCKGKPK